MQASHHRVLDAGVVLDVVNARRPGHRPSRSAAKSIDDASARHVSAYYAMVLSVQCSKRS
jgi:hypothetical protein